MKQSQLFSKTRKEIPSDETSKNAILLIKAGFVNKEMAGVYSFLPLGLRVLNKVNNVIRDEINKIGGIEILLSSFQDKTLWQKTNRWNDEVVDNWFKTNLKNGGELGLGFTHEEPLTWLMREHIHSFRDLPIFVYQIQTKFRNETRTKSGLMRCREFIMKDLYSFNVDTKSHDLFYEKAKQAYIRIFDRCGLGNETYVTFASGGSFSKYSHEFQTITEAGEDTIYVHEGKRIAINKEVLNEEVLKDLGVEKADLVEKKAVEVGNIFSLGTKFSDALGLNFKDQEGNNKSVIMGSYGIGPARVMGTVVEIWSDDKGLVWPESLSPFDVHIVALNNESGTVAKEASKLYEQLIDKGVEVLYDDRDCGAGEKFADADLIGIPKRYVISEKTLKDDSVEFTDRRTGKAVMVKIGSL